MKTAHLPQEANVFPPCRRAVSIAGRKVDALRWLALAAALLATPVSPVSGQSLTEFRADRTWERFNAKSFSLGPSRGVPDRQGGLWFWFQLLDWVNGQPVGAPIKLKEADGAPDPLFRPGVSGFVVHSVAPLPNGGCYVGLGRGAAGYAVMRWLRDGRPDPGFKAKLFTQYIRFLTVLPDGGVLLTFSFGSIAERPHPEAIEVWSNTLIKLRPDGEVDPDFYAPEFPGVAQLFSPPVVDPEGRIYVAGRFTTGNNDEWTNLVRLRSNGAIDRSFVGSRSLPQTLGGIIRGIGFQSSGKIVVVGDIRMPAQLPPGSPRTNLFTALRFSADGVHDPSFARTTPEELPTTDYPRMMTVQADDRIVVAATGMKRLNADGSVDRTFQAFEGKAANFWVQQLSDGRLLMPGIEPERGVLVFDRNGRPDDSFVVNGFGATETPEGIVLGDGRVLLAGLFNRVGAAEKQSLAVLAAESGALEAIPFSLERAFPTASYGFADFPELNIAPSADGGAYLTGYLADSNGVPVMDTLVKFRADGTLDDGFRPAAAVRPAQSVQPGRTMLTAAQGGVWVARTHEEVVLAPGPAPAGSTNWWPGLLRLEADGRLADGFRGLPPELSQALFRYQENGWEIALGTFRPLLAARNGGLWATWATVDGGVTFGRLTADGQLDSTFEQRLFPAELPSNYSGFSEPLGQSLWVTRYEADTIRGVAELPDGSVLIVGDFEPDGGIALLNPDGSRNIDFRPGRATYSRQPFGRPEYLAAASDAAGRILVAGLLETVNGVPTGGLVEFDRTGRVLNGFPGLLELVDYPRASARLEFRGSDLYAFGTFRGAGEEFPRPVWKVDPGLRPLRLTLGTDGDALRLSLPCDGPCPPAEDLTLETSPDLTAWARETTPAQAQTNRLEWRVAPLPTARFYRVRRESR